MKLTEHFSFEELTATNHTDLLEANRAEAKASIILMSNLTYLANTLEEIRSLLGVPLRVTSGYRNNALNARVGGSATSGHKKALCGDVVPIGMTVKEAFRILSDTRGQLETVRKVIVEGVKGKEWLHIQTLAGSNDKLEFYATNDGKNFTQV